VAKKGGGDGEKRGVCGEKVEDSGEKVKNCGEKKYIIPAFCQRLYDIKASCVCMACAGMQQRCSSLVLQNLSLSSLISSCCQLE
jgi:hypothetical protein